MELVQLRTCSSDYIRNPFYKEKLCKNSTLYHFDAKHLSKKSHAVSAVIVKNNIKQFLHSKTIFNYLQSTTVSLEISNGPIKISGIYSPFRHNSITSEQ